MHLGFQGAGSLEKGDEERESIAALLISVICVGGAFVFGVAHGRDQAYDEAFDNALRTINEVYEEETWNRQMN